MRILSRIIALFLLSLTASAQTKLTYVPSCTVPQKIPAKGYQCPTTTVTIPATAAGNYTLSMQITLDQYAACMKTIQAMKSGQTASCNVGTLTLTRTK